MAHDYRWRIQERTNWIQFKASDAHAAKRKCPAVAGLEVRSSFHSDRWVKVARF